MKIIVRIVVGLVLVAGAAFAAWTFSPWPKALLIRWSFDAEAEEKAAAMEKHVPPGVVTVFNEVYDPADGDAKLDVFYPQTVDGTDTALPTIVWTYGGGWVSGRKEHVAPYLKILAAAGYVAIGINYSIAPGATYPTPVRQLNAALAFVTANAARYHVDPTRLFLGGDSAGSQIASQYANVVSVPAYAERVGIKPSIARSQLRGVVLMCGAFDAALADFNGPFGGFLTTVMWSYSGTKDFLDAPAYEAFSVRRFVDASFPPAFITAGNGDPLLSQSQAMAETLKGVGVEVDELFFAADRAPALPHEYQFNLDDAAGQEALKRTLAFLAAHSG